MPVNAAVTSTTGSDRIPTSSICFTMLRISEGGRTTQERNWRNRVKIAPRSSNRAWTRSPTCSTSRTAPFFSLDSVNVHPGDSRADLDEDLIRDGPADSRHLLRAHRRFPHHLDVRPDPDVRNPGDVDHRMVHAHRPHDGDGVPGHRHPPPPGQSAPVAVRIADGDHGDPAGALA